MLVGNDKYEFRTDGLARPQPVVGVQSLLSAYAYAPSVYELRSADGVRGGLVRFAGKNGRLTDTLARIDQVKATC